MKVENPKNTITLTAKCADLASWRFLHEGYESRNFEGELPSDIQIASGDYINLTIDIDTGKIVGWKSQEVKDFLSQKEAEEECPDMELEED